MCRVKIASQREGLIPSEAVVKVSTRDEIFEEVVVSPDQLSNAGLEAALIHQGENWSLIELPRESSSGKRRVWVENSQLAE